MLINRLLNVWESSVKATHLFLLADEIENIKQYVPQALTDVPILVIAEDKIKSLRRFKDDVKEVAQGYECGIGLERFNDIKEGDIFEAFTMEEYRD